MTSDASKKDFLITLAFLVGLVFLVVQDTFFYSDSASPLKYWLNIANTALDATLFTIVFLFLKREIHRRRAETAKIAAANRLKSDFMQIAAHDLRNPLNAILLVAAEIPPGNRDADDPVAQIRSTASEMLGIIEALLDATALEDGSLKLNCKQLDLAACVREVVERNRPLAKRKKQELLFSPCDVYLAEIDRGRIKQAVDNLVSNAIKFSPKGASTSVSVHCVGGHARIEVTDQGAGLTEEDMKKLFGQFQRLSARPTDGEPSTGLGLANARRLVELHGGKIGAESNGPGQGSRFWIEIPAQIAADTFVAGGI